MTITGARISGSDLILTLSSPLEAARLVHKFKAGEYDLVKQKKRKSLEANNMLWSLCEQIAGAIGSTKEDVYRDQIRQVGSYYPLPIKEKAVEQFKSDWRHNGIGWFVDVVDDSKLPGYKLCFAYIGSSKYDTEQMSRLIDNVIQDCVALGIETRPQEEIDSLLGQWEEAHG